MKKQLFILSLIGLVSFPLFAQDASPSIERQSNKGRMYVFWGWNRGWYTNSDIHFTGENYDFTLNDVYAYDRQTELDAAIYLNPNEMTIPQTNLRIGYFINDKIDISIGVDHMKYVMRNGQSVKIKGYIDDGSQFDNTYNNDDIDLDLDFLIFEHTDGLNYINSEITRNDDLMKLLGIYLNPNKVQINTLFGFGLGFLMPRTNATLWNKPRNDEFHVAGYGFDAKIGLNTIIYKYFFIRSEFKGGFIDMPDIRTSPDPSDRASQHFFFNQLNFVFGLTFYPFGQK